VRPALAPLDRPEHLSVIKHQMKAGSIDAHKRETEARESLSGNVDAFGPQLRLFVEADGVQKFDQSHCAVSFWLALSEPHARAVPVLLDEDHAGRLEGADHLRSRILRHLRAPCLVTLDRWQRQAGRDRKLGL